MTKVGETVAVNPHDLQSVTLQAPAWPGISFLISIFINHECDSPPFNFFSSKMLLTCKALIKLSPFRVG